MSRIEVFGKCVLIIALVNGKSKNFLDHLMENGKEKGELKALAEEIVAAVVVVLVLKKKKAVPMDTQKAGQTAE